MDELLAITEYMAALVVVMIGQGKPLEAILPTLRLFAAAAFRVMPSISRVLGALQNVRFYLPVVDTLYSEYQLLNATKAPQPGQPLLFKNALILDQIKFSYASAEGKALRGVSLSISRGSSVGVIGGSGAGQRAPSWNIILACSLPLFRSSCVA